MRCAVGQNLPILRAGCSGYCSFLVLSLSVCQAQCMGATPATAGRPTFNGQPCALCYISIWICSKELHALYFTRSCTNNCPLQSPLLSVLGLLLCLSMQCPYFISQTRLKVSKEQSLGPPGRHGTSECKVLLYVSLGSFDFYALTTKSVLT